MSWADSLVFGGFDDWRLPYISRTAGAGPTGSAVDCSTATELACRDNELGCMYHWNLTPGGDTPPTNLGTNLTANHGPFTNIQSFYWSGTEFVSLNAWAFDFGDGDQGSANQDRSFSAWAVHPGDITVPEPGSLCSSVQAWWDWRASAGCGGTASDSVLRVI